MRNYHRPKDDPNRFFAYGNQFCSVKQNWGGSKPPPYNPQIRSTALPGGAFAYFFPKLTAQMAAVKGTASMTPMELATPEMASRLM